jgi:CspA family cold shock protein
MREKGRVRFTVAERGYGFILRAGCLNLFFHATAVRDANFADIRPGDLVEFEVIQTDKGLAAVNVTLA